MENNMRPDELYHWGIKGMRWGVRRYQNSDGSLTDAGRKRYDADDPEKKSIRERIAARKAEKKAAELKKKRVEAMKRGREEKKKKEEAAKQRAKDLHDGKISIKDMTDEELAARTARLQSEKRLKDAVKDVDPGRRIASKLVNEMIVPGIVAGGRDLASSLIKHYGAEWLGLNEKDAHTLLRERAEESRWRKEIQENNEWVKNHSDKNYLEKEKQKKAEQEEFDRLKRESQMSTFKSVIAKNTTTNDTTTTGKPKTDTTTEKPKTDTTTEKPKTTQNNYTTTSKDSTPKPKTTLFGDSKPKQTKESTPKYTGEVVGSKKSSASDFVKKASSQFMKTASDYVKSNGKSKPTIIDGTARIIEPTPVNNNKSSTPLLPASNWVANTDWDVKAHTPSKKTGRDAGLYDQHLSRNEEEFLKRFMK